MKNTSVISILIFILFTETILAQESTWNYDDYHKYTINNFREIPGINNRIDFKYIDYPLLNAAIFYVTNEVRVKSHLEPLNFNLNLEIAAWNHSRYMAEKDFFNHVNPSSKKRREPNDRGTLAGITNPNLAENIAESFGLRYKSNDKIYVIDEKKGIFSYDPDGTPILSKTYLELAETLIDQWMHSKPHKKNILAKEAKELGCGAYLYFNKKFFNMPMFKCTQNFQGYYPVIAGNSSDPLPHK